MEVYLVASICVSIFCHWMGLTFFPEDIVSAESTLFIVLAVMCIHKIMISEDLRMHNQTWRSQLIEAALFCIAIEVLMFTVWRFLAVFLHTMVNRLFEMLFKSHWLAEWIRPKVITIILVSLDVMAFKRYFELDDVQMFFGSKEDRLSESILALLDREEARMLREQYRQMRQMR